MIEKDLNQLAAEQFQRDYFDWSEEEFAKRFVESTSAWRLTQDQSCVDLKLEKKSLKRKFQAAYHDVFDLPNLVKMLLD